MPEQDVPRPLTYKPLTYKEVGLAIGIPEEVLDATLATPKTERDLEILAAYERPDD